MGTAGATTPTAAQLNLQPQSQGISARLYSDALTAPAHVGKRPAKPRSYSNLVRMAPYLGPYLPRYIGMFVIAAVTTLVGIVTPLVTRTLIDGPIQHHSSRGVLWWGLLALTLGIAESVLQWLRRWLICRATMSGETGIRVEEYAKLQHLPQDFHRSWQSGQLLSRVMNDLGTVRRFLNFGFLFLVMNFIQIVVVSIMLCAMYLPLGLIVIAAVVPVAGLCLFMHRKLIRISRLVQDQTGDVASSVEESVQGLRVIKAFGRSDYMFDAFDTRARRLFDSTIASVKLKSFFWTFLEVIPNLTLVVVLGMGAMAAAQHRITIGTLVAFITLLLSLIWPVSSLGFLLSQVQEAMTAADRVCEIFDAPVTIADGPRSLDDPRGALAFHDVSYQFPDSDKPVLDGISLAIAPGETLAIVGGTGSGKTVLTNLVPRLMDVTGGSITIDGVDIRELTLANLRSIVATAFEDPTLFSMSVRENLTLGRADATDDEIASAIEVAQAGFVYDLPWGLATRIGEQGMSLSGGQRQRLALARAVLVQPKILVLDDTLSALDIHTEALVEEALKRVLVGVTGIVVAHRASTVLLADRVAMLVDGRIAAVGTHAELLASNDDYRDLLSGEFNAEKGMDLIDGNADLEGGVR